MSGYISEMRKLVGHRTLMQCAASVICVDGEGRILLGRRTDNHLWGYAGGSAEIDERIEDCARRELQEETGLTADELTFFCVNSGPEAHYIYPNGDEVSNMEMVYLCRRWHGNLNAQEDEIEELRFFRPEEITMEQISPPIRPVMEKLLNLPKNGESRPLTDLIGNRRSYRGKYRPVKVPREDLETILRAGLAAPSGCNKQTTSLIAVDDPEMLRRLHEVIRPPVGETAPAMICVLTERINAYRDRCFAVQDYAAAIENMLLAITALGYQSCWYEGHITDTDRIGDQMAVILGVPDRYDLVCFLPVGIAESDPPAPPKKKSFEERAWFNAFQGE